MTDKSLFTYMSLLLLLLVACSARQPAPTPVPPTPTSTLVPPTTTPSQAVPSTSSAPDYWPTAGWRTSTPEEQGMDSEQLAKMFDFIREQDNGIHTVSIIRNGTLIADAAIYPYAHGSKHNIHSCTKSITSALIGIAIDQGYIESVTQPVLSFFPDRMAANLDAH